MVSSRRAFSLGSRFLAAVALVAAAFVASAQTASAIVITVPDDVPTIQAALDSLDSVHPYWMADSLYLRGLDFPESPTIARPLLIKWVPASPGESMPRLAGATILGPEDYLRIDDVAFSGPVHITNCDHCAIDLNRCRFDARIVEEGEEGAISFRGCTISPELRTNSRSVVRIDSSLVRGSVNLQYDVRLVATRSTFEGDGSGTAIYGWGLAASVSNCIIKNYAVGISVASQDYGFAIFENTIEECHNFGINTWTDQDTYITGNTVRRCGVGIDGAADPIIIRLNRVEDCTQNGIVARPGYWGFADGNVVVGCGGDGMRVVGYAGEFHMNNNTCVNNGGSGLVTSLADAIASDGLDFIGNIAYGNAHYGLLFATPYIRNVSCNDWYANQLGAVGGGPVDPDDFQVDPRFCDLGNGDFHLASTSPLVNVPGCPLIGALGVGCDGPTPVLVSRFDAERASEGVRVRWQAPGLALGDVSVERSVSASGPWLRPVLERSFEGDVVVDLDRTAAPDRAHWYRLVTRTPEGAVALGQPLHVEAAVALEFRLGTIAPNPAPGPARIEFTLPHASVIAVDVFDVQGRMVASPARGTWPAGPHVVAWPSAGAQPAAGLYLVRYRFPGGEQHRRLVLSP